MDSIKGHGRLRIARFEEARRALQWYCYTLLFGMLAAGSMQTLTRRTLLDAIVEMLPATWASSG
jgi:hypothetical protein